MEIEKKKYLGCNELVSIIVNKKVKAIGEWAFARCRNLECITLYSDITEIGRNAFWGCDSLREVYCIKNKEIRPDGISNSPIADYHIPVGSDGTDMCLAMMRADGIRLGLCGNIMKMLLEDPDKDDHWISEWDGALMTQLLRPADYGYEPFCAGGEEDYEEGEEARSAYILQRMTALGTASADRLILSVYFGKSIAEECRLALKDYLSAKTEDKATVFSAVLTERKRLLEEMVRLIFESGIVENVPAGQILERIPAERPELRSLILRYSQASGADPFSI